MLRRSLLTLLALSLLPAPLSAAPPTTRPTPSTFRNPVVRSIDAPDPWVIRHGGWYYFTATLDTEGGLWVWRSKTLTGLDRGDKVKVWTAPRSGPQSHGIWAPELHFIRGKWYLYYTATDGPDAHHRMFVLEAKTDDPLGEYVDRGRVDPDLDHYAIDGSVLALPPLADDKGGGGGERLYWMYTTGKLWIAPMTSPTRVDSSRRVEFCRASEPWERGWVEGPEPLVHNGKVFVAYSAGHSGTPHYSLGLLTLTGNDPLDPAAWTKTPGPVFAPYFGRDGAVYNVGHNGFTKSPDGREDWIIYHAKDWRTDEPKDRGFNGRTTRIQPFTWHKDGTPDFGHPIPSEVPLPVPSGE